MLLLPLLPAVSDDSNTANISTAQYSSVLAGHTTSGQFCVCPSPGCIPDRGEICDGVTRAPAEADSPVNFGGPVLLLLVAGFAFLRLRSMM